ncbi:MAG: leucine-rich repeat domain-containing protein [Clostridia bacterium]
MKKFTTILVAMVLAASMFAFVACGKPAENTAVNDEDFNPALASADFEDGTWTLLESKDAIIPSEVDGAIATDPKFLMMEPYSTTGYKVRGFSSVTEGRPTDLVIPNVYNGLPVVMIDTGSFRDDTTITSVKMGSNMKYVYANAFRDCSNLREVVLGTNVKKIHHAAFKHCTSLTEIVIPAYVTHLEGNVFSGCTSLSKVTFQKSYYVTINEMTEVEETVAIGVRDFAVCVFMGCTSLKEIELPETLTTIGMGCFRNAGLVKLTIPRSVNYVGSLAFSNCTELVVKHYKIKTLAEDAFYNCADVTKI